MLNLGKIGEARLDLIPKIEECRPGLRPTEYNVIVAPARVAKTLGASGVLQAPDEYVETAEMAMQVGRIVSMSPLAFNYDAWKDNEDQRPKVGDIIWYARYAGALIESAFDGQMYRMIKDKDVAAVIEQPDADVAIDADAVLSLVGDKGWIAHQALVKAYGAPGTTKYAKAVDWLTAHGWDFTGVTDLQGCWSQKTWELEPG